MPAYALLEHAVGEDVTATVTFTTVTAIAGWAIKFTVQDRDGNVQFTKVTGGGITITDGVNGIFTVAILRADTSSLAAGSYRYDIWRTDSGSERELTAGEYRLNRSVSGGV